MVEAVLFDNDGVLVDTESAFFQVTRDAFAGEGAVLTPRHWARAYLGEGRTSRDIASSLGVPEKRIDALVDGRNRTWRKRMEAGVPLRPRVRETLEALHGKVRMAVVTGSPREQFELVHRFSGLTDFFDAVLTEDDFERSKPHPDAYLAALRRLGLPPDRCLAVEDSPRGLASASSAGLRCILVPTELTDLGLCGDEAWTAKDLSGVVPIVLDETGLKNK